jgi:Tfp pilus assembly protein PilE
VVAIIAILAAIAVPNFLEAQTRSKISRVKADMRSVATGLEAYCTDNNAYPIGTYYNVLVRVKELTTPVAYLTTVGFHDPFMPVAQFEDNTAAGNRENSLTYYNFTGVTGRGITFGDYELLSSGQSFRGWMTCSNGPDRKESYIAHYYSKIQTFPANLLCDSLYDPTNGTVSSGDISRVGGNPNERTGFFSK